LHAGHSLQDYVLSPMLKFSDLAEIMDGQIQHLSHDHFIRRLLTDSRQLVVHPEALFFAIQGNNHDGHQYLDEVLSQNIVNFIIQQPINHLPSELSKVNVISVKNSVRALQALSEYHRSQFNMPVLGITGSNAKTIIKEWLFQLLEDRVVVKSPKSYNSQIGVPLSVWQLNETCELGIFEAGISKKGEMDHIASIIKPTMGIFTNIGTAHDVGFYHAEDKIREKCQLFRESKEIIYRRDHRQVHEIMIELFPETVLCSWSTEGNARINYDLRTNGNRTMVSWDFKTPGTITLPFSDTASVENALHCVSFMLLYDYSPPVIDQRVGALRNIPHRLALRQGINNCYLVDDTYNNDLAGLGIALDFLNQQAHGKEKALILSDIHQASGSTKSLYQAVSERVRSHGIDRFYGVGKELLKHQNLFPAGSSFFDGTQKFLQWLTKGRFENQLILVKGARDFTFEKIVQLLLKKHHGTVLEINLDALAHNLNFYRKLLPAGTKVMVMVKAFAYGTGSHEVANLLQYHGVDYLGVAYADEGVDLRKQGIQTPIMVMNTSPDNFEQLVDYRLEPEIYSMDILGAFQDFCRDRNISHKIHIKLDTGMHRLGFDPTEISALATKLAQYPLPVVSVFSHLAAAENPEHLEFTQQQYRTFIQTTRELESLTGCTFLKHILNSAGIQQFPEYHLDMVRLGIGLYGIGPGNGLKSISTLITTISQIKNLDKGETVGYDRSGALSRKSKIATIAIGYADGYDRRFGNGTGKVLVGNKPAPVIGNVCMDMTMVDVTDCEAEVGDQVVMFNDKLTIQELARNIGTIPYELLTKISERVKRVYYQE